jgi:short-chain fatty acids transporter
MLRALSRPLVRLVEKWLPSSLVFAVILSFLVAILALTGLPQMMSTRFREQAC